MSESRAEIVAPAELAPAESQFSLAGLMIFITWLGMCLGAAMSENLTALAFVIIVVPAILRTWSLARSYRREDSPLGVGGLAANFFASLGLMVACSLAAVWATTIVGYALFAFFYVLGLPAELVMIVVSLMPIVGYAFFVWASWSFRMEK